MYFIRYPVLSCEKNKAIWLANLLMNYYELTDSLFNTGDSSLKHVLQNILRIY
jgi:hypothetical protein